ncbi:MAG: HMA2 domain-containing protein [Desulfotignum sp.]
MNDGMQHLPTAKVVHQMNGRIRFRITGVHSDTSQYFATLTSVLADRLGYGAIRVNPVTGTVLLADPALDMDAVATVGRSENLFMLTPASPVSPALATRHVRTQVHRVDRIVRALTANQLDLPGSVFLGLVIHAIREIVQGNLMAPSWFTALWVASSLYNRDFTGPGGDGGVHPGETGDADAH